MTQKVITPTDFDVEFDVSGPKVSLKLGPTLVQGLTGDLDVAAGVAAPVAQIVLLNKIGLTAQLDGGQSSGLAPLTYAWSGVGPGTVTFGAAAAAATGVIFGAVGTYTLTLTVTDGNGNSAASSLAVQVDRVLHVNGVGAAGAFTKLQDAFDWITANDAVNDSDYLIEVWSTTQDTARIAPTLAMVHFQDGGRLTVGVDFAVAGNYAWGADASGNLRNIEPTTGIGISVVAGVALNLAGVGVVMPAGSTDAGVQAVGGGALTLLRCVLSGGTVALSVTNPTGNVRLQNCRFAVNVNLSGLASGQTHVAIGNLFLVINGLVSLTLSNANIAIVQNEFRSNNPPNGTVGCVVQVDTPTTPAVGSIFANNVFRLGNTQSLAGTGAGTVMSLVRVVPGGALGKILFVNNSLTAEKQAASTVIALHFVGAPTGTLKFANNYFGAATIAAAIQSTSDNAAAVPLVWNNAPFYNNTIDGAIVDVNFAVGTLLNGGNVQV